MHPRPLETICYLLQQAVEKQLKAFIISSGEAPPKTHDLNQLCELCEEQNEMFADIARSCGSLTKYAIAPRYPFELEILEDETETALSRAETILTFIDGVFNQEGS